MENSIKEDIKILETLDYLLDDVYSTNLVNDEERNKYQYAIEHILSDYKRILKENEELLEVKVSTSAHNRILELEKENEELKNNTRKNENELEFDIDCDWIALQKMLDESEKSNEYISYKNEKWIKEKYCIPIQKVKDKIEELNRKIDNGGKTYGRYGGCVINSENIMKLQNQIEALQELLEKE